MVFALSLLRHKNTASNVHLSLACVVVVKCLFSSEINYCIT